MSGVIGLQGFMGSVSTKDSSNEFWENYCYIAANEWHWSVNDIHEAPIPFVLQLIETRSKARKEEERENKRKNR